MTQFIRVSIPSPFAFLQVQIKIFGYAVEFGEPWFGKTPEAFNTIDVPDTICKLILSVINAQMFRVADIDQAAITAPAVRINNTPRRDLSQYDSLKCLPFTIRNDFGINSAVSFENTKDGLLKRSSATL